MSKPAIYWMRSDFRLADNPALHAAIQHGGPVIPVFIGAPDEESPWEPGGASCWWLHQTLTAFDERLREVGSRLIVLRGPTHEALRDLVKHTGASAIFWNRRYEPRVIARDTELKHQLRHAGLQVETFNAALLHEPWTIQNKAGKPFQVFTPFWKTCLTADQVAAPLPAPKNLPAPVRWPRSLPIEALDLEPKINWAEGIRAAWQPGEAHARNTLKEFLKQTVHQYPEGRNRPDIHGTSRLSPHLHFGEISPRHIWHALDAAGVPTASQYRAELGWREFAHHLLYHFPNTPEQPLRPEFRSFRWRHEPDWLKAWQRGRTGYPIVDAGMRELWTTGWMHNRVRMIVASFLVKDLLISWNEGTCWFWDTLVDADLAQNTLGWQWTAGCGADATPYFRVFNPVTQGEKFDSNGEYVRRWCPELGELPNRWIHQPWSAPPQVLSAANIHIGANYPERLVSHTIAREVALEEYARLKRPPASRSAHRPAE